MLEVVCAVCGKIESVHPSRAKTYVTCSRKCSVKLRKAPDDNCKCPVCGKLFHCKPSYLKRLIWEPCCSRTCNAILRKEKMSGENNHQYGLNRELNASFKSNKRVSTYGYILIYSPKHPFRNCDDAVLEHRLVAEKFLLTRDTRIAIEGNFYLKPELEVHHKDFNRQNNLPTNLEVLSKSSHMSLHHKLRKLKKAKA